MFFKWIAKFIIAINANTKPGQLSGGIACAMVLSFLPVNLFWFTIFFIIFFIKINTGVMFIFLGIFGLLSPLLTDAFNTIGFTLAYLPGIYDFLMWINNIPVISLMGIDYTLTLGGLACGIVLFVPVYLLFNLLIKMYRKLVRDRLAKTKIIKRLLLIPVIAKLAEAVRAAYTMYVTSV
ncbi:MAG: TIGR03546 family protein [Spirochaetales bacterium]|nr:TIGR03546 family protein [Spirochaetales bacterium]